MKTICHFELGGAKRSVKGQSLVDFKTGFWLDNSFMLTFDDQEKRVWIPPARILHVERVK